MEFLEPGETCWRIEPARRIAFLVDAQDYFSAVRDALAAARHSILLLGWAFDPRTRLQPDGFERPDDPDEIGHVLLDLARERPELDIRLLIWRSALPIAASQEFFPHRARAWFKDSRVSFRLDDMVPLGACHHQKVLVIDNAIAFCGSGDFGVDRWDSPAHLDADSRRIDPDFHQHPPRHEVMMLVDGPAAEALGELGRDRWRRACGETLEPPPPAQHDPWPAALRPEMEDAPVAIARTEPAWRGRPLVREWEALTFRSIALAKRRLYLENQYFTAPDIAEAISRRLSEPDGPEVVLISTEQSPSYFDRFTMDRTRSVAIRRLQAADVFGRFRAYCPETSAGHSVIVHAKVTVVDDQLLRIGSANLNNRSGGFDTECELAIEAFDDRSAAAVDAFRDRLVGHYLGRTSGDVATAITRHNGLIPAIEALNTHGRLRAIAPLRLGQAAGFVAAYHIGDPHGVGDAWRPLKRRRLLEDRVRAIAAVAPCIDGK
ncbi:MAG TPA: phospholipase D-like domain-containing protein [Caulobacteraceae bacterium]|jgi:phosphatidylserine/phosphatidylglycerophosphate/cardiolipin synthase-like enzyme|nr:phospholipase D-like domain-containing protein [Caulobacteraceae bacterium]